MDYKNQFSDIPSASSWCTIEFIDKGWSEDKKYLITNENNTRLLLRVSDINQYDRKKFDYCQMKRLEDTDIIMSRPLDFGRFHGDTQVYTLLTWLDGVESKERLPSLSDSQQYSLGIKAGKALSKIHQIPAPETQHIWSKVFNAKIDRNIRNHNNCSIQFDGAEYIIDFLNQNRHLLLDRPLSFQHGDYHCGNMIITPQNDIGIIDFNRLSYGDPWEEFNRITFCATTSPLFASGRINGYFDNNVPELFFKLLALYISSNQLACVPWAIPFGQKDVDFMLKQSQDVLDWFDNFSNVVPKWYTDNNFI
ncbi:MAG: phosphotransferase [Clostridiales bacterium]|nr:phosphotransferase [Clostridiales bacterium]